MLDGPRSASDSGPWRPLALAAGSRMGMGIEGIEGRVSAGFEALASESYVLNTHTPTEEGMVPVMLYKMVICG